MKNIVRHSITASVIGFLLLCPILATTALSLSAGSAGSLNHPDDPSNLLQRIQKRGAQKESLFPVSPLGGLHDSATRAKQSLYEATSLELGFTLTHLFQRISEAQSGVDQSGMTTWTDFVGTWELVDKGTPTQGQFFFDVQGRWNYGTTGPGTLGSAGLGSLIGTANGYEEYVPTFILRNAYWRQGSPEAGWSYRVGKFTVDGILSNSAHISPLTTFHPVASTGPFSIALPDSGFGAVGSWYVNDRTALVGVVSDANADRFDSGDVGEGDFFTALELQYKVAPRTSKAGYSKLTLWNTEGNKNGEAINGMRGPSGWGIMGKLEMELTDDGRAIGILRYGHSFNDSALFEQQASAHFLFYDPPGPAHLRNDLIGVAFNWAKAPVSDARSEYNLEVFYRFPLFPHVDTTLSYQSVIDPAFDHDNDHASVFSLRLQTVF